MKGGHKIALALIGILLVTVVFAPVPGHTRWLGMLHNSAHAPLFGVVAVLVLTVIRSHARLGSLAPPRQYFLAFVVVAALGVATELAQMLTGRDASLGDALNDVLGALAFLGLFYAFDARPQSWAQSQATRAVALIAAGCLLAAPAAPVVRAAVKYQQRDHRFPVLAEFSRKFDRYFIRRNRAELEHVRLQQKWAVKPDEWALRVRFLPGLYPGMEFIELSPDWSAYSMLALDLTNPTMTQLELLLRVHDAHHTNQFADRFNKRVRLAAATRTVLRIPLAEIRSGPQTRPLDLRNVAGIILFRTDASPAEEMYVSKAWLE